MIAVGEYLSAAAPESTVAEGSIDIPRCRDLESLHTARERSLVVRLDQHVNMVALQADVRDPDPLADRGDDRCCADRLVHVPSTQTAHGRHDAQHDVKRMTQLDVRPRLVRRSRSLALRLAPGSLALAAILEQHLLNVSLAHAARPRHCHTRLLVTMVVIVNLNSPI